MTLISCNNVYSATLSLLPATIIAWGYWVYAQTLIYRFMQNNGPGIFQQDNARPHKTRLTKQFLAQINVNVLPLPALFRVMNPI